MRASDVKHLTAVILYIFLEMSIELNDQQQQ